MKRRHLIWHILPSFVLVIILTVTVTVWYANRTARELLLAKTRETLYTGAAGGIAHTKRLIADDNLLSVQAWISELAAQTQLRYTVIMPDGTVIADSEETAADMENHRDRPEIQRALRSHMGQETRRSSTLNQEMMYLAMPVPGASAPLAVFRTSAPVGSLEAMRNRVARRIILTGLVCILAGAGASVWITRRITTPVKDLQSAANRLTEGDFNARLRLPQSRELASLAASFNAMATQLERRIETVTRQKNEVEAILCSMVEGVVAIDQEQTIINMNAAAGRMLGLDPASACGRGVLEVIRNPALYQNITRTLDTPEPVEGDVILYDRQQETHLQVHGSRLPTFGQSGETGAVLVLNDVTRLKRLELMRREFAANVSHELRTPITSITGFVETLLDGALENHEDSVRFLTIIRQQAKRLNALITDLLSLANIEKEAETGDVERPRTELAPELRQAAATAQARAAEKNIRIELTCPDQLEAHINRGLFQQALANLLDNALKYSPADTVVRLLAEKKEDTGDIRIQVIDQGRGIAPEHIERLFERFYRVDKARSRDAGGTGLGLAIVKHVIEVHNGRVEVNSSPGKGSTFTVVLPPE